MKVEKSDHSAHSRVRIFFQRVSITKPLYKIISVIWKHIVELYSFSYQVNVAHLLRKGLVSDINTWTIVVAYDLTNRLFETSTEIC